MIVHAAVALTNIQSDPAECDLPLFRCFHRQLVRIGCPQMLLQTCMDFHTALRCGFFHLFHSCLLSGTIRITVIDLHGMSDLRIFLIDHFQYIVSCKNRTGQIADHVDKFCPIFI